MEHGVIFVIQAILYNPEHQVAKLPVHKATIQIMGIDLHACLIEQYAQITIIVTNVVLVITG